MLAYVFWHWPRENVAEDEYAAGLVGFHRRLAAGPPRGFWRSCTFRVAPVPWLPATGPEYEDWYLVDDFAALEALNAGAVSGSRAAAHDRAAHAAAGGAGGLYRRRRGELDITAVGMAAWLSKPDGASYADFDEHLRAWTAGLPISLWQRQLVLGPAPEYCLLSREGVNLPEHVSALVVPHHAIKG